MLAHGELLVCFDFQIGTGAGGAEENESGCSVFGIVGYCIACVEFAGFEQASGAGEAATLMADRRQFNSCVVGCVPDVLIFSDIEFLD
jgi:hypothetical protein